MKLCDRCRVSGCCLNYLGEACQRARKRECPDVVFTNFDSIQDKSDEELAKFFCPETPGPSPWCEPIGRVRCRKAPCWKCMLKWLRQPAEEEWST